MSPENHCAKAECEAVCCSDTQPGMSAEVFYNIFLPSVPDGYFIREQTNQNLKLLNQLVGALPLQPSILYARYGDRIAVQIIGMCPLNDPESFNCKIYPLPSGCRNVKRGGKTCSDRRLQEGLIPIPSEYHE